MWMSQSFLSSENDLDSCDAMVTPKMYEEVKEQLKQKGKDAHFGSEKTVYRIQEQLLDTAGPLTVFPRIDAALE